jgi:hypothetical protein
LERVGPFFLSHQMNWSGSGLFFCHTILFYSQACPRGELWPIH